MKGLGLAEPPAQVNTPTGSRDPLGRVLAHGPFGIPGPGALPVLTMAALHFHLMRLVYVFLP